jgi:hypothetical protein
MGITSVPGNGVGEGMKVAVGGRGDSVSVSVAGIEDEELGEGGEVRTD